MKPSTVPTWYPLVHGRTYEVDYRSNLLAVPPYFTQEDVRLVMPYILSAMGSFDIEGRRRNVYHYAMFRVGDYCVFGLGCMAHQVCADPTYHHDMTQKRVLPMFLGYITRDPCNGSPPMLSVGEPYSAENTSGQFTELFRYVIQRWREKTYRPESLALYPVKEDESYFVEMTSYRRDPEVTQWLDMLKLNSDEQQLRIWPAMLAEGTEVSARDRALWTKVWEEKEPISLCLGIASQSDALRGPFMNASAYNVATKAPDVPLDVSRPVTPTAASTPTKASTLDVAPVLPPPAQIVPTGEPIRAPDVRVNKAPVPLFLGEIPTQEPRPDTQANRTQVPPQEPGRRSTGYQNADPRDRRTGGRENTGWDRDAAQEGNTLWDVIASIAVLFGQSARFLIRFVDFLITLFERRPPNVGDQSPYAPPSTPEMKVSDSQGMPDQPQGRRSSPTKEVSTPPDRSHAIVPAQSENVVPHANPLPSGYRRVTKEGQKEGEWDIFNEQQAKTDEAIPQQRPLKPHARPVAKEEQKGEEWDMFGDTSSLSQRSKTGELVDPFFQKHAQQLKKNPSRELSLGNEQEELKRDQKPPA